jgi:hypothetical protein
MSASVTRRSALVPENPVKYRMFGSELSRIASIFSVTSRSRSLFFDDVIGVSETEFKKDPSAPEKLWMGQGRLRNLKTGRIFYGGQFEVLTLGELRKKTEVDESKHDLADV